jgi:hypothetical protein
MFDILIVIACMITISPMYVYSWYRKWYVCSKRFKLYKGFSDANLFHDASLHWLVITKQFVTLWMPFIRYGLLHQSKTYYTKIMWCWRFHVAFLLCIHFLQIGQLYEALKMNEAIWHYDKITALKNKYV